MAKKLPQPLLPIGEWLPSEVAHRCHEYAAWLDKQPGAPRTGEPLGRWFEGVAIAIKTLDDIADDYEDGDEIATRFVYELLSDRLGDLLPPKCGASYDVKHDGCVLTVNPIESSIEMAIHDGECVQIQDPSDLDELNVRTGEGDVKSYRPCIKANEALFVNDHGNRTYYVRGADEQGRAVWYIAWECV